MGHTNDAHAIRILSRLRYTLYNCRYHTNLPEIANAVPRMLEGFPDYISSPPPVYRHDPTKRRKNVATRHIEVEEKFQRIDKITSFNDLTTSINQKLESFP